MSMIIRYLFEALSLIVLAQVIVSYFLSPYHPVRAFLDRIVEPMLTPIRRYLKPIGGLDFSPVVLLILIQIVSSLILSIL